MRDRPSRFPVGLWILSRPRTEVLSAVAPSYFQLLGPLSGGWKQALHQSPPISLETVCPVTFIISRALNRQQKNASATTPFDFAVSYLIHSSSIHLTHALANLISPQQCHGLAQPQKTPRPGLASQIIAVISAILDRLSVFGPPAIYYTTQKPWTKLLQSIQGCISLAKVAG